MLSQKPAKSNLTLHQSSVSSNLRRLLCDRNSAHPPSGLGHMFDILTIFLVRQPDTFARLFHEAAASTADIEALIPDPFEEEHAAFATIASRSVHLTTT